MTPEEFFEKMKYIAEILADDPEACHVKMDDLMCQLLNTLGYGEGVKVFVETDKWYA